MRVIDEEREDANEESADQAETPVPARVKEAFGEVCRELSGDQASALASFFEAFEFRPEEEEEAQAPNQSGRARARAASVRRINIKPGLKVGPVGKLLVQILESYPRKGEITITSAYRPGTSDHHGGLSYGGSPTAAIDIGGGGLNPVGSRRMRDVAKWLYDNFAGDTVELIHTTPYNDDDGFYVKNQKKYPGGGIYGPETRAQHRDHVHFATSKALAGKILSRLGKGQRTGAMPAPAPAIVWGWDASSHDWKRGPMDLKAARKDGILFFTHKCSEGDSHRNPHFKEALERARTADIPVMGAYHVLWPGNPVKDAHFFFSEVNSKIPWWKGVPWIWQLDAEKFEGMPRPPSPSEGKRFLDELKRLTGQKGYFIAYAPEWQYHDSFNIGYDLWASNYTGSGAPRPFKEQYKGVPQSSWDAYSGRKPRILQFASDAKIGRQNTCDANRFYGDLNTLIKLTGSSSGQRG